ncbi:hypothetical protein [Pinibacter aurantiacus]|uniref:Uncharacterized protein n=1 Tax=Pinibacter aurantiacus TaxID=2851599 RepID=A0A9E2W9P1_9BACT|nr:hypothetical protein [Pinibacter aurantiacus]MBV4360002.1 hypothetical protein [Pinibacter aurantiacus]
MNKISTYRELVAEEQRLSAELATQKLAIQTEWNNTKQQLKPFENALGFVSKISTKNKSNPLLNMGLDLGVDVLIRRLLLGNAGFVTKLLVPTIIRNYSSNMLNVSEGKNWFSRLRNFFKRSDKKVREGEGKMAL